MSCCFGVRRKKKYESTYELEKKPEPELQNRDSKLQKRRSSNLEVKEIMKKTSHVDKPPKDREVVGENKPQGLQQQKKDSDISPIPANKQPKYELEEQKVKTSLIDSPELKEPKSSVKEGNNNKISKRQSVKQKDNKNLGIPLTNSTYVAQEKRNQKKQSQIKAGFQQIQIDVLKPPKKNRSQKQPSEIENNDVNTVSLIENPKSMKFQFYQPGSIVETPMVNTFRYDMILSHVISPQTVEQSNVFSNVSG